MVNRSNYKRKIWLVVLLLIPVIATFMPMSWIEGDGVTLCLWHNITGSECYGCGITRALVSVMKFRFTAAWEYNRLVVLVFPLILWLWTKEVRRLILKIRSEKAITQS